jgi:hypothetical protein
MKRALTVMLVLGILLAGSIFTAYAANWNAARMKVSISFPFYVGEQQHPSGDYWIEVRDSGYSSATGSTMLIRNQDGSVFHFLPTRNLDLNGKDAAAHLIFNRVGENYFLSQVHQSGWEARLYRSRSEKELSQAFSKGSQSTSTVVVAFTSVTTK